MLMKWLVTLAIVLFVLGLAGPFLARLGLGRQPGDISARYRGRRFYFPIATSIIRSLVFLLLLRI